MRCVDEGRLRAYLDGELGTAEQERVAHHLSGCAPCDRRVAALRGTAAAVSGALERWMPEGGAVDSHEALILFRARLGRSERTMDARPGQRPDAMAGAVAGVKEWVTGMMGQLMAPRRRPVFATMAILAMLAGVLALGPVQSLAQDWLKTFRVQKFSAITVRVPQMGQLPQPREISDAEKAQLMQMFSALGTLDTNATPSSVREVATLEDARAHLTNKGGTLRTPRNLPAAFANAPVRYGVGEATVSTYTLNVAVAKQYLSLLGSQELNSFEWPEGVDKLTFGLDVPASAVIAYGDETKGFGVLQMASPTLSVPSNLDVTALRTALLGIPGLPADTIAQLRAVENWEKTLIIPVPQDATTENPDISGNPGLLILDGQGRGSLLLWQDDDILYAVGGNLTRDEALAVARSMR